MKEPPAVIITGLGYNVAAFAMSLLSVNDARERILAAIQPVTKTRIALDGATGRVLAQAITAASKTSAARKGLIFLYMLTSKR